MTALNIAVAMSREPDPCGPLGTSIVATTELEGRTLTLSSPFLSTRIMSEPTTPGVESRENQPSVGAFRAIAPAMLGNHWSALGAWFEAKGSGILKQADLDAALRDGDASVRLEAYIILATMGSVSATASQARFMNLVLCDEEPRVVAGSIASTAVFIDARNRLTADEDSVVVQGTDGTLPLPLDIARSVVRRAATIFRIVGVDMLCSALPPTRIRFTDDRVGRIWVVMNGDDDQVAVDIPVALQLDLLLERTRDLMKGTIPKVVRDLQSGDLPRGVRHVTVHITDGYVETIIKDPAVREGALQLALCAFAQDVGVYLIPDTYAENAAREMPEIARVPMSKEDAWRDWERRRPTAFWRGHANGRFHEVAPGASPLQANKRLAFLYQASAFPTVFDCRVLPSGTLDERPDAKRAAVDLGIIGDHVSEADFRRFQVYIDLDGWSSSWGTIRKFAGMCAVVMTPSPWQLAWHDRLRPGVNCLLASTLDPGEIAGLLRERSSEELFEIAYAGHVMAIEWLNDVLLSRWSYVACEEIALRKPLTGA